MLTAYLFDRSEGRRVEAWPEALRDLSKNQVLWVDLVAASPGEEPAVREVFGLEDGSSAPGSLRKAGVDQHPGYLAVTAIAVSDEEEDAEREMVVVDCFVGPNWVLTVHEAEIAVIEDFKGLASGEGELGDLDAPSFLSALLEWVIGSYMHAFDEIETRLEEFDIEVLSSASRETDAQIETLIAARRRVGRLRRSLSPHRDVFTALGHTEFDPLSSESSSERFVELTARLDAALASAREVKDAIASSFDVLIVRTEHRTNEIVKVLTLASILLLPGTLIAGVLGMNINFSASAFVTSAVFWTGVVGIVAVASATFGFARARRWI
ncbi:MAG TPA: CorA family divalent cation transporter [Gaiellaceae bacterium]|nr:CorA family divalent cation transporter [Gaiellaceae bacterium]